MGENFRIVHVGDPASSFPLTSSGFRHLSPEYLVTSNNEDYPKTKDVLRRETDENGEGIIGTNIQEAIKAHEYYFGLVSACYKGPIIPPLR